MEGPSQTLLGAKCPPHFCTFFCCIRFVLCLSVVIVVLSFKWKKCMNDTYIKKRKKTQLRFILFVRFRITLVFIHITLTSLTFKPSFVRGPNNPHIGLRPYLEKLKIRVETRHSWKKIIFWYPILFNWQSHVVCYPRHQVFPVIWGCRIYHLLFCIGVRPGPSMSDQDMILNNVMVRLQYCWSFGECREPLHCHRFLVNSCL